MEFLLFHRFGWPFPIPVQPDSAGAVWRDVFFHIVTGVLPTGTAMGQPFLSGAGPDKAFLAEYR